MDNLSGYVIKTSIKETFMFKFDFILMSSAALFQLAVQYYFLKYIFHSAETIGNFTLNTTLTYLLLNCSLGGIFTYNVDMHLRYDIQYGKIITLLSKPVHIPYFYLLKGFGIIGSKLLTESFLLFFIALLFFHPIYVPDIFDLMLFLVSFILGLILFMQINLSVGFITFFIGDNSSVIAFLFFLRALFSGSVFPLDFFPFWLKKIGEFLPFRLMIDTPFKFFLGFIPPNKIFSTFFVQLIWISIFYIFMRIIYSAGIKRYHSVGG